MNILITGATGFIGKRMLEILAPTEHHIRCLLRNQSDSSAIENYPNVEILRTAFDNQTVLEDAFSEIEVVIHLAGQMGAPGVTYEQFYAVNCELTEKLLEAAHKNKITQFIYCSTPGVLGFGKRLAKETDPYAPRNDYEKTKVMAEKIVRRSCKKSEMKYTIIRPDFVYGPGDTRRVGMYKLIRDKHFVLTTSGKSYLHPTYIDDVVQGFLCCLLKEKAYNQTFNIAAQQDVTAKEYLETIAKHTNSKLIRINIGVPLSHICAGVIDALCQKLLHREGFVTKNKIDFLAIDHSSAINKAQQYLGYAPQYSCDEGFKKTIQWCKENKLL